MLKMWPRTSSSIWTALLRTTLKVRLECQIQTFTFNRSQRNHTRTRISTIMDSSHKINLLTTMKLMITWFPRAQWCKMRRTRLPIKWEVILLTLFKLKRRKVAEIPPILWAKVEIDQLLLKMVKDWKLQTFSTKLWPRSLGVKIESYSLWLTKRRSQTLNHSISSSHNWETITQWACSLHLKHAIISMKLLKSKWCRRISVESAVSVRYKMIIQPKCSLHTTWSNPTKWLRWIISSNQTIVHLNLDKTKSRDLWLHRSICQPLLQTMDCKDSLHSLSRNRNSSLSSQIISSTECQAPCHSIISQQLRITRNMETNHLSLKCKDTDFLPLISPPT